MMLKTFVLVGVMLLLSACATTLPHLIDEVDSLAVPGSDFEGMATILVFRDEGKAGMGWPISVECDGASEGSIRRHDYVKFGAPAGRHVLLASWPAISGEPDVSIGAEFQAGKTYYFAFNTDFRAMASGAAMFATLGQISEKAAKARLVDYTKK
jgi:hypothetical protein